MALPGNRTPLLRFVLPVDKLYRLVPLAPFENPSGLVVAVGIAHQQVPVGRDRISAGDIAAHFNPFRIGLPLCSDRRKIFTRAGIVNIGQHPGIAPGDIKDGPLAETIQAKYRGEAGIEQVALLPGFHVDHLDGVGERVVVPEILRYCRRISRVVNPVALRPLDTPVLHAVVRPYLQARDQHVFRTARRFLQTQGPVEAVVGQRGAVHGDDRLDHIVFGLEPSLFHDLAVLDHGNHQIPVQLERELVLGIAGKNTDTVHGRCRTAQKQREKNAVFGWIAVAAGFHISSE